MRSGNYRIFYGGLCNETNAFSPIPCAEEDFVDLGWEWARDSGGPFQLASTAGCEIIVGANRFAQPAGLVLGAAYESLCTAMLAEIAEHLPLDAVLLNLHGAMATREIPDCEGDILRRVRELVGSRTFVGATLDPHCHLSDFMIRHADVLTCYKEYPHTDIAPTTRQLTEICLRQLEKPEPLLHSVFDCDQIGLYYTTRAPMRQIVEEVRQLESQPGIVSISIAHGFPWGDNADLGTKVIVYSFSSDSAQTLAARIGQKLISVRGACGPDTVSPEEALRIASHESGLTVAADIADNPGGGAPGDSTLLLQQVLASGLESAVGPIWDPIAVEFAFKAGVGARLQLRVGGKAGPASGAPIDVDGEIVGLAEEYAERAPGYGGILVSYGDVAGIRVGSTTIVLCSQRNQAFSPALFEAAGARLKEMRLVVVKSIQHFYAGFAAIASRVLYVDASGALSFDFASLPRRLTRPELWPLRGRAT